MLIYTATILYTIKRLFSVIFEYKPMMTGDRFVSYFCELNYSPTYSRQTLQLHVSAVGAILLFHYTFDNLFESIISKVVHHP